MPTTMSTRTRGLTTTTSSLALTPIVSHIPICPLKKKKKYLNFIYLFVFKPAEFFNLIGQKVLTNSLKNLQP